MKGTHTTKKLYTVFALAALVLSALPLMAHDASAQPVFADKTLNLTGSDYKTVVSPFLGIGSTVYVVMQRSGSDASDTRDVVPGVLVTSSEDTGGFTISLLETGPHTGTFLGSFRFTAGGSGTGFTTLGSKIPTAHNFLGAILGDGQIKVASSASTFQVKPPASITDIAGLTGGVRQGEWKATNTGSFLGFDQLGTDRSTVGTVTNVVFGYSGTLVLQVTDKDLNKITSGTSARESYDELVLVTSTSDPRGVFLKIQETGDGTSAASIFQGTMQFEATLTENNDRLFVRNNDLIHARYFDFHGASGDELTQFLPRDADGDPLDTWRFRTVTDGIPTLDRSGLNHYYGGTAAGGDVATIIISDLDADQGARQDRLTVTASSTQAPSGVPVVLYELGGASGLFAGTLHFTTTGTSVAAPDELTPAQLRVGSGAAKTSDTITIEYSDATDALNAPQVRQVSASWRSLATGVLTVGATSGTTMVAGLGNPHQLTLNDWDANKNPLATDFVDVVAVSTTKPGGILVRLTEVSDNSGEFVGVLRFSSSTSSSALQVTDRDHVQVLYNDPLGSDGKPKLARTNSAGPIGSAVTWRGPATGTIETDATQYFFDGTSNDVLTVANVYIFDQDRNDPRVSDSFTAVAVTIVPAPTQPKSVSFEFQEIGIDSGIFHGELLFRDTEDADPGLPIEADSLTRFRIEYTDPLAADGSTQLVATSPLEFWRVPGATARFETSQPARSVSTSHWERQNKAYICGTAANPVCQRDVNIGYYGAPTDADAFADAETVQVKSLRCTANKAITVSGDDGVPRLAVTLRLRVLAAPTTNNEGCAIADVDGIPVLGISATDTVTLSALDVVGATLAVSALSGEAVKVVDSTFENDVTIVRGANGVAYVKFTGGLMNEDTAARDVAHVTLTPTRGVPSTPIPVQLVEKTANSDEFIGSFGFCPSDCPADLPKADTAPVVAFPLKRADNGVDVAGITFGGGIQDGVRVSRSGGALDGVAWVPATDPVMSLSADTVHGSEGTLTLTLTGDDGQTGRVRGLVRTGENLPNNQGLRRAFTTDAAFVVGSELVYLPRQVAATINGAAITGASFALSSNDADLAIGLLSIGAAEAGEPISDRNRNGVLDCGDITMDQTTRTGRGGVPIAQAQNPAPTCREVRSDGSIVVRAPDCQPADTACDFRIAHEYRARALASGADSVFEYTRGSTGSTSAITFGAGPAADTQILIDYTPASHEVVARSIDLVTNQQRDLATLSLPWVRSATFEGFRTTVGAETAENDIAKLLVGPNLARLEFVFNDPFTGLDGRPGSADIGHFRATSTTAQWKPSSDGVVRFTNAAGTATATSPIFGPCVPVEVSDPDANVSPARDAVQITARRTDDSTQTRTLVLRETDGASGVFRGIVPIRFGSGSSAVKCDPTQGDDKHVDFTTSLTRLLVVTYVDPFGAAGSELSRSATTSWQPSQTATIQVSDTQVRGSDGGVVTTITDADANTNPSVRDVVTAKAFSDTDRKGITITLTENGVNSGVFVSSPLRFKLTADQPNSAGRLLASYNDVIQVAYDDPRDSFSDPVTKTSSEVVWLRSTDGAVTFDFDLYIGNVFRTVGVAPTTDDDACALPLKDSTWKPGEISAGLLTLRDDDLNANRKTVEQIDPPTNLVVGPLDTNGVVISTKKIAWTKLVETGANTGEFIGVFGFTEAASAVDEQLTAPIQCARIPVVNSDRIGAVYTDQFTAAGTGTLTVRDDARWFQAGFGILNLDKTGYRRGDATHIENVAVTLYDSNANTPDATTAADQKVVVRATSQEDPTGFNVDLVETADDSGIYRGSFKIADTASALQLKVRSSDVVTVVYQDASPAGPRTITAPVSGDFVAPVTTLATTPAPLRTTDGVMVFQTKPTIAFTSTDPDLLKTTYKFTASCTGTPTVAQTFDEASDAFQLDEGCYRFLFASVDKFGNTETPEKDAKVLVDLAAPTATLTNVSAKAVAGGKVEVSWAAPSAAGNPLEACGYAVYVDAGTTPSDVAGGNDCAPAPSFVHSANDEVAHTYRVAVKDLSGRIGPLSTQVSATPDATLPTLSSPLITPTGFDTRAPPAGGIAVRVAASDKNLDNVVGRIVSPTGTVLVEQELALASGTTYSANLPTTAITQPCLCKLNITASDKAGNQRSLEFTFTITGPDSQAPTATLAAIEVRLGEPLTVTVADNVGLFEIRYRLDNGPSVPVTFAPGPTATFEVPAAALSLGNHNITIEALDTATNLDGSPQRNVGQIVLDFTVVSGDTTPPPSTNFLPTRVSIRSDGVVVVSWDVPSGVSGVGGFQVWRSSSPFALVGEVANPSARTFVDTKAVAGTVYRYVVTFYSATPFSGIAQVPGYVSDDQVPASAPVGTEGESLPQWLLLVIGVGAFLVVAAIIAVLIAGRRGGARQETMPASATAPPAEEDKPQRGVVAMETHRLRCPQCSHRFEVSGTKPIVTNCPNCGRKGILR